MSTLIQGGKESHARANRLHPAGESPFEYGSNPLRLSGKDWLAVAVLLAVALPLILQGWPRLETISWYARQVPPAPISASPLSSSQDDASPETSSLTEPPVHHVEHTGPADYRVPFRISNDFWSYTRWCQSAAAKYRVLVVGDSTIWGYYVESRDALPQCLNRLAGADCHANMGLSGLHDMAMFGLLRHFGEAITGKKVLLHFDPLWMNSEESDLRGEKEFHFQDEELAPQFSPSLKCYRADVETRLTRFIGQHSPLSSLTTHILACYFDNTNLNEWMMSHPDKNPWRQVTFDVPWSGESAYEIESAANGGAAEPLVWSAKIKKPKDYPWVMPSESLQWGFFREVVALLRSRNNEVFVMVGPFNPYALTPASLHRYRVLTAEVVEWLGASGVPHFLVPDLPTGEYGDVSHPLKQGYVRIAEALYNDPSFKAWSN